MTHFDQVGGNFAGNKQVIIVDDSDDIVASATVSGTSTGFVWSTLHTPLQVEGYLNEWVRDFNAPGIRYPN